MPSSLQPSKTFCGVRMPLVDTGRGPKPNTGHFLHTLLREHVSRYKEVYGDLEVPRAKTFSTQVINTKMNHFFSQFEALRQVSPKRAELAKDLVTSCLSTYQWQGHSGEALPLPDYMRSAKTEPLELETYELGKHRPFSANDFLIPRTNTHFRKSQFTFPAVLKDHGARPADFGEELLRHNWAGEELARALCRFESADAPIGEPSEKWVLFGGLAELSSLMVLMHTLPHAEILVLDKMVPTPEMLDIFIGNEYFNGTLHFVQGGADLVQQPAELKATIEAFSNGDALHFANFAYAGGRGLELGLGISVLGILSSLDPTLVRSFTSYNSPTVPGGVTEKSLDVSRSWHRPLQQLCKYALGTNVFQLEKNGPAFTRAGVDVQGAAYMAGQLFTKRWAAEAFYQYGPDFQGEHSIALSMNTAGISNTASLYMGMFQSAFLLARYFGVRIFHPLETVWLNGLLALDDISTGRYDRLRTQDDRSDLQRLDQLSKSGVHGDIHSDPIAVNQLVLLSGVLGTIGAVPALFTQPGRYLVGDVVRQVFGLKRRRFAGIPAHSFSISVSG